MSKVIIEKVDGDIKVENISTTIENKEYTGAMFTIALQHTTKDD